MSAPRDWPDGSTNTRKAARPPDRKARHPCRRALRVADREDDHATRPAPHRRNASVAPGVDTTVIALWLSHEQVETTQMYLHADLALKDRALARTKPLDSKPGRYRPPDAVLGFRDGR
jgi:hypothetical protein